MLTVSSWCGLSGVVDGVAEKVVSESAIEDMEALGRPKGKVTGGGEGRRECGREGPDARPSHRREAGCEQVAGCWVRGWVEGEENNGRAQGRSLWVSQSSPVTVLSLFPRDPGHALSVTDHKRARLCTPVC